MFLMQKNKGRDSKGCWAQRFSNALEFVFYLFICNCSLSEAHQKPQVEIDRSLGLKKMKPWAPREHKARTNAMLSWERNEMHESEINP